MSSPEGSTPNDPKRCSAVLATALQKNRALLLAVTNVSLSQFHQFFRHPLADAFRSRSGNAFRAIVPFIVRAFRHSLAFVVFGLLQREDNALRDAWPIVLLNAAQNQGQTRGPIFLRRPRVLFRNRQIVSWRQRPKRKIAHYLRGDLFIRSLRILFSDR